MESTKELIKRKYIILFNKYKEQAKITVSELCEQANISRNTFYYYFQSLDDVLDEINKNIDTADNEIKHQFISDIKLKKNKVVESNILSFLSYVKKNAQVYLFYRNKFTISSACEKLISICKDESFYYFNKISTDLLEYGILMFLNSLDIIIINWVKNDFKQDEKFILYLILKQNQSTHDLFFNKE